VPRALRGLFDDQRPAGQTGVGPDRLGRREDGPAGQLVPDRQGEAEVDVLRAVQLMVDAVVVGADEDSLERPEAQVGVRVRERDDAAINHEQGCGQGTVGDEDDARDQGDEVGNVDERVRAEHREHVHVLLGMVQLVEAPEHSDTVVGQVGEPIAPVHGHKDHRDGTPARHGTDPGQDEPWDGSPDDLGEGEGQGCHERYRDGRVQERVEKVLAVTTSEQWSPLRRVYTFHNEEHSEDGQGQWADYDDTKARHRPGEVCAAPMVGPTDPDEDGGYDDDRASGEVNPRRQCAPRPARTRPRRLCWCDGARTNGLVQDRHGNLSVLRLGS
jgi:hypothetical protein